MTIQVIRQIDYKGVPIYIRKIGTIFEYLVIFENKLYNEYFDITLEEGKDYTKKQLESIVKMVYFAAYKTIDTLIIQSKNIYEAEEKEV